VRGSATLLLLLLLLLTTAGSTLAAQIAIIIDDVGENLSAAQRLIAIPGPLTLSILPHTSHAERIARLGHSAGKEIMLHQPMEAIDGNHLLGPGSLIRGMDRHRTRAVLQANIASIPHVSGINNHMGSLLTRFPQPMRWVMEVLQQQDLFFVDSKTSFDSVARLLAMEQRIPNAKRNIFLDHSRDPTIIEQQFNRLLRIARETGSALAIGHPYPETIALLEQRLPRLAREGVARVSVKQLIQTREESTRLWHASLSPSPADLKN
jgi:uncharacterized protein